DNEIPLLVGQGPPAAGSPVAAALAADLLVLLARVRLGMGGCGVDRGDRTRLRAPRGAPVGVPVPADGPPERGGRAVGGEGARQFARYTLAAGSSAAGAKREAKEYGRPSGAGSWARKREDPSR